LFYSMPCRAVIVALWLLCCPVLSAAETLTFSDVLVAGLKNAFDRQIGEQNLLAAEAAVDEARADYYPQLSLRYGQEYVHVYDKYNSVVSVGGTVYSDSASKYKNSFYLSSQYTLFDFGRRKLGVDYAKQQTRIVELQLKQQHLELSRTLLELYTRALKLQKQLTVQQLIMQGQKRVFRLAEQLQQAGRYGRQDVGAAALALAEAGVRFEDLQVEYRSTIADLSFYLQQQFNPEGLHFAEIPLSEESSPRPEITESFPEVLILQQQIEKKRTELAITKRTFLPQLTLSGSFGMYGSNDNSYRDSIHELSKRDASISLAITMALFDGFESRAKKRRLGHELASLKLEKNKKMAELQNEYRKVRMSYQSLQTLVPERRDFDRLVRQQTGDLSRLSQQQMTDQVTLERQRIEYVQKQLTTDLQRVDYTSAAMLLSLLNEAGS